MLTGVTQEGSQAWRWLSTSKVVARYLGKSGYHIRVRADSDHVCGNLVILCCLEKPRREGLAARTLNRLRWSGREY